MPQIVPGLIGYEGAAGTRVANGDTRGHLCTALSSLTEKGTPMFDERTWPARPATLAVRPGTVDPGPVAGSPDRCTTALPGRRSRTDPWTGSAVVAYAVERHMRAMPVAVGRGIWDARSGTPSGRRPDRRAQLRDGRKVCVETDKSRH